MVLPLELLITLRAPSGPVGVGAMPVWIPVS
jgi:hypothetical protein